jgi:hypothetical protein
VGVLVATSGATTCSVFRRTTGWRWMLRGSSVGTCVSGGLASRFPRPPLEEAARTFGA